MEKNCKDCRFAGMDMDMDPYCAHPETLKIRPFGSNLCRRDEARDHCGEAKTSWKARS